MRGGTADAVNDSTQQQPLSGCHQQQQQWSGPGDKRNSGTRYNPRVPVWRWKSKTKWSSNTKNNGSIAPSATALIRNNPKKKSVEYKKKHLQQKPKHTIPAFQRFCYTPSSLVLANTLVSIYALLTMDTVLECSGGSIEADHLCVLVHGLWGNPAHMAQVVKSLRAQYPPEQLYILVAKRNSGSFTYDGIELGGERVCLEIEEELQMIESRGGKIKKLSIVGYSLGGLVARYAIGLLHAKGILDQVECMNFTAFASPFLGVRTPLKGMANQIFNVLGARTLCMSGRQLFTIDKFRDTGRPLLHVLTDPHSIFMSGLRRFKRHTLYANIVNDRTAVYYTTGISKTDPYVDLSKVRVRYVKGYEDVVLDPDSPFSPSPPNEDDPVSAGQPLGGRALKWLKRIPFFLALAVFVPIGLVAFLVNSGVQTIRSLRRVRAHNKGLAGTDFSPYRLLPLWIKEVRGAVEDAYEELNSSQDQQFLGEASDSEQDGAGGREAKVKRGSSSNGSAAAKKAVKDPSSASSPSSSSSSSDEENEDSDETAVNDEAILALERKQSHPAHPTLALAPYQFEMVNSLDTLRWRKYPVWIHNNRHSHAAIIVRTEKPSFAEGYIVFKHWLNEEFLM